MTLTTDTPAPDPAAPVAATSATSATPAAAATPATPADSLLAPSTTPGPNDWLPTKFHVNKDDGTFDEGASSRKLAESYSALEKHKGALPDLPADADGYKIEGLPGELNFDEIKADPLFKGFLKGAHGKGLNNDQVSYVLQEYFKFAPELGKANAAMTVDEARADLAKVWTSDAAMQKNLDTVVRAVDGFGTKGGADLPGSPERLRAKYGTDPDFLAFAARVAGEMSEDKLPGGMAVPGAIDAESLMKSPAYRDANHPDHTTTKTRVQAHFRRMAGEV